MQAGGIDRQLLAQLAVLPEQVGPEDDAGILVDIAGNLLVAGLFGGAAGQDIDLPPVQCLIRLPFCLQVGQHAVQAFEILV